MRGESKGASGYEPFEVTGNEPFERGFALRREREGDREARERDNKLRTPVALFQQVTSPGRCRESDRPSDEGERKGQSLLSSSSRSLDLSIPRDLSRSLDLRERSHPLLPSGRGAGRGVSARAKRGATCMVLKTFVLKMAQARARIWP